MKDLIKNKGTNAFFKYPDISFIVATGRCNISGESFMENSREFYSQIFVWLKEFNNEYNYKSLVLEIRLLYFNTSSSNMLFEMLKLLQDFKNKGQKVFVNWYYNSDETELYGDIMDLCYDVDLEIDVIPV